MKTKQEIRQDIKSIFSSINRDELKGKNDSIIQGIYEYIENSSVKHICVYESLIDEVETTDLIAELEVKGYKIYTLQMIGETEMILIDNEYEHYEKEIDLFIVPGRAFSSKGKRLGRGRGYYDRFLTQQLYKKSKKLGICYDFQLLEDIPTQKHDITMNKIITND